MIRIICPSCNSKLSAKEELIGQTRRCPKCSQPILIAANPAAENDNDAASEESSLVVTVNQDFLPVHDRPDRLNRDNHYLICDKANVVAAWSNNGNGWMLKTSGGFASARRNRDKLPNQGEFQLVELKISMTDEGKRLTGLMVYHLASRYALTVLDQGDDLIVEKIVGPGALNRDQKNAVRKALKEQFMRPVWENAASIVAYLANQDFHSHHVE